MKAIMPIVVPMVCLLSGCAQSALQADYGTSVQTMTENQVYDKTTLVRPSLVAGEGADPEMLTLAVTNLRGDVSDRKQVAKPLVISIGGQGAQ